MNDTTNLATRILNDLDYAGRQVVRFYGYERAAVALQRVEDCLKYPQWYFKSPTTPEVLAQFTPLAGAAAAAIKMMYRHDEIALVAVEGLRAQIAKLAN